MDKEKMEGFKALAFLIDESLRKSKNPREGQLMPKDWYKKS